MAENEKQNQEEKSEKKTIGLCRCGMPIVEKDGKTGCINPTCANNVDKQ